MKRTLSLLLAAALAAALLVCPAAAAAPAPWAQVDGQSFSLQGLSGQYHAIQVTLKLNQPAADTSFHFDASLSNEQTYTTCTTDGNNLTLYVSSGCLLNQGGSFSLGSLSGQGLTLESVSNLKLIKVGLNPSDTQTLDYDTVSKTNGSSSGSGGNGGGYYPDSSGNGGYYPGSGGSGGATRYSVGAASAAGGTLRLSSTHAAQGETVTVTATPNSGYRFQSLTVTDSAGRGIAATNLGGGKWSFTMPASAVTVTASFTPDQSSALPFTDVGDSDWFRDSVAYVYSHQLMNGTAPDAFSPYGTTTRAMIVTILYRYEGSPAAGGSSFQDVPAGQYYTSAVAWAAQHGVVNGYNSTQFAPNDSITREQMAAILYRYAQYKGLDVSGRADLSRYTDGKRVSSYARDPMSWANHQSFINGVDSHTLQPGGFASRAQVATILMRFCQYVENP